MDSTPQTFGEYLKAYFKNFGQLLKHPAALLPTVIITVIWLVLGFLRKGMNESPVVSALNFLTFAQGGIFGGVVGAIGGVVGKILVASLINALVMPLFVKGARPMARFKEGFKGFGKSFAFDSAGALSALLGGMGLALFLYSFLNITQRWQEGLVGIAASVLLIRSIGQKGGFLFSLLYGFLKGRSKDKLPSQAGITRFLSGMTLGFTGGTALNLLGLRWAILVSLIVLALALLLGLLAKNKHAAATLTCIALLAFVPLRADSPAPQNQDINKQVYEQYSKEIDPMVSEINRLRTELQEAQESGDENRADRLDAELQNAVNRYGSFMEEKRNEIQSGGPYDQDGNSVSRESHEQTIEDLAGKLTDVARKMNGHVTTHGWTDEWDHTHDKGAIGLMDGIAGIGAAAAAAGAAGGAAGAGGAGSAAGGGPDFPGGEEPGRDAERREEDEPGTEGGDGEPGEEEDDYDYEAERAARQREQEEINRRYGQAHQDDWKKFSTTSDQERITREAEEAVREQEQLEMYRKMLEEEEEREKNVLHYADKYGIPTTNADGSPREIWEIEHDTQRASMWEKNKGIYKDSLDIQQIASEVELECSEKIAEYELVDKVTEGTVNILGECVPGGKIVKDAHGFVKAVAVSEMEAIADGRNVVEAAYYGHQKGMLTVLQNHTGDIADMAGVGGLTKFAFTGAVNIGAEGGKEVLDGVAKGKSFDETMENVQNAIVKKTGEHLVGSALGATGMDDGDAATLTEFTMRGHDEIKFGQGDDAKTLSETVTSKINDAKNGALSNVMYYTGMY